MEHQEMTPQESPHITWRSILGGEVLVHLMRKQANLIILIMILVILYIDNRYSSQQEMIEIDRLKKELIDTKYDALTISSELTEKSRQSRTDCSTMDLDDINNIFNQMLYQFPIEQININFPHWVDSLPSSHWLKLQLFNQIKDAFKNVKLLKQVDTGISTIQKTDIIEKTIVDEILLGTGFVNISIQLKDDLFYKVLTEISGVEIANEGDLFSIITSLAQTKKEYDKISYALESVKATGYGIVTPSMDELILEVPSWTRLPITPTSYRPTTALRVKS